MKNWQHELTFVLYMALTILCIFAAIKLQLITAGLLAIVFLIMLINTNRKENEIRQEKVTYEVIPILGRKDMIAVKQVVIPKEPIRFPEFIETKGQRYKFSHVTDSPLMDGAYYILIDTRCDSANAS